MGDREKFLGDMDFIKIPYDGLLSKDYARERRKLIDPANASIELRPGSPEKFANKTSSFFPAPPRVVLDGNARHEGDTSYIAVVDKDRNMVSFEPSLHESFGTGVVMGNTGFIFNCRGDYYSLVRGEANALEPGKRPRSTLQSTLVMKDGQPYAIMGSPGGDDQVMRTMQTLINVIDFGMKALSRRSNRRAGRRAVSRHRPSRTPCTRATCRSRRVFPRQRKKRCWRAGTSSALHRRGRWDQTRALSLIRRQEC